MSTNMEFIPEVKWPGEKRQKVESPRTPSSSEPSGRSVKSIESLQLAIIKGKAERQQLTEKLSKASEENRLLRAQFEKKAVDYSQFEQLKTGHAALVEQLKKVSKQLTSRLSWAQQLTEENQTLRKALLDLQSHSEPLSNLPDAKFMPLKDTEPADDVVEQLVEHHCITASPEYSDWSFEELRVGRTLAQMKSSKFTETTALLQAAQIDLAKTAAEVSRLKTESQQQRQQVAETQPLMDEVGRLMEQRTTLQTDLNRKTESLRQIQQILTNSFPESGKLSVDVSLSQADSTLTDSSEESPKSRLADNGSSLGSL